MYDDEGSRSEFLRILAEMGEEPAFIARALAPQAALEQLLASCASQREEMLHWPRIHLTSLFYRLSGDWTRLERYIVDQDAAFLFAKLVAQITIGEPTKSSVLTTDRSLLRQFVNSGRRFNKAWMQFLRDVDLEDINGLREDYNRMYPLEKECAFGPAMRDHGFAPLSMLDSDYLVQRFPILLLPTLR